MTIDLHIPTCWEELTTEQLRDVVELGTKELRREEYLLILLCKFSGIKMVAGTADEDDKKVVHTRFKDAEGHVFDLEDWQVSDFSNRLEYTLEDIPLDVEWPFRWNRYLMDTTFGAWFHADAQMLGFAMDNDPERLKCAMKDLGDPHYDLQPNDTDMVLFLKWYERFTEWLQSRYPLVFEKSKPGDVKPTSPVEARQNIMLMLTEGKPQDNQRIDDSKMHDVLAALQYKIEYAKQIEEKLQEIK